MWILSDLPRFLLLVFCFFLAVYGLTTKGYPLFVDEELMFQTAVSIVERQDFNTECHPWTTKPGRNGLCYSNFGIGQSLYEIPFLLVADFLVPDHWADRNQLIRNFVSFSAPVIAATLGVLMILCVMALGMNRKTAWQSALLVGFCTMVWPYSKMLFRDPLQCLLLFASITALVIDQSRNGQHSLQLPFLRRHLPAVAGICLGAAVMVKETMILFAPILAIYLLHRKHLKFRRLLAFGFPLLAGVSICLLYNVFRFDNWLDFGYTRQTMQLGFSTPIVEGLFGLLISSGRGFFIYNPVLILSLFALPVFFRRFPAEACLFSGIFLVHLLFISKYWTWDGSWAWGPRFLLILVPITAVPIAVFHEELAKKRWKRLLFVMLVITSVLVQIPGLIMHVAPYFSLIAHDVRLFPSSYDDGVTFRNDMIHVDFIPQFSPIWGLLWTLKHSVSIPFVDVSEINLRMKEDCPWGTLSPSLIPANPEKALGIGPDLLIVLWKHSRPDTFIVVSVFYLINALIAVFCYIRIRKMLVPYR